MKPILTRTFADSRRGYLLLFNNQPDLIKYSMDPNTVKIAGLTVPSRGLSSAAEVTSYRLGGPLYSFDLIKALRKLELLTTVVYYQKFPEIPKDIFLEGYTLLARSGVYNDYKELNNLILIESPDDYSLSSLSSVYGKIKSRGHKPQRIHLVEKFRDLTDEEHAVAALMGVSERYAVPPIDDHDLIQAVTGPLDLM